MVIFNGEIKIHAAVDRRRAENDGVWGAADPRASSPVSSLVIQDPTLVCARVLERLFGSIAAQAKIRHTNEQCRFPRTYNNLNTCVYFASLKSGLKKERQFHRVPIPSTQCLDDDGFDTHFFFFRTSFAYEYNS